MFKGKKNFVAALFVIVMVLVTLALPYALTEAYGLEKKWTLLVQLVVLAVFSEGMLIWWLVRHRQTSHNIETLREEIERTRLFRMRQREIWYKKKSSKAIKTVRWHGRYFAVDGGNLWRFVEFRVLATEIHQNALDVRFSILRPYGEKC